jgi:hypothetical protein
MGSVYSQGGLMSGRRSVVTIITEYLSQHDEKHTVLTPTQWDKWIGKRKEHIVPVYYTLML